VRSLLLKTATPATFTAAGQLIAFDLLITNTSTVTMSAITAADTTTSLNNLPVFGATAVTCPQPELGPGESEHCTVTHITKRDGNRTRVQGFADSVHDARRCTFIAHQHARAGLRGP
jgi:hypothetical protein